MNITVDELMAEIGRLHVQIMALQKQVVDLQPKPQVPEKEPAQEK